MAPGPCPLAFASSVRPVVGMTSTLGSATALGDCGSPTSLGSRCQAPGTVPQSSQPHSSPGLSLLLAGRCKKHQVLQRRLTRGLPQLQSFLAALPPTQRREALDKLSKGLRGILLQFLESSRESRAAGEPHRAAAPTERVLLRKSPRSARRTRSAAEAPRGQGPSASKATRGISAMKVRGSCGKLCYVARATVLGIAITSRPLRVMAEVQALQAELVKLQRHLAEQRQAFQHREMEAHLAEGLLRQQLSGAFNEAEASPRSSYAPHLQQEMWRFRATVDARAWVGKTISSRQVDTIAEALSLRQELQAARCNGWAALKEAWVKSLQEPRRSTCFGHRALTETDAARAVQAAERFALEVKSHKDSRIKTPAAEAAKAAEAERRRSDQARRAALQEQRRVEAEQARTLKLEKKLLELVQKMEKALSVLMAALSKRDKVKEAKAAGCRRRPPAAAEVAKRQKLLRPLCLTDHPVEPAERTP